jgi:16S rRNA (adenine1518-N6/adenine1519-N6)-dimethyltransferase
LALDHKPVLGNFPAAGFLFLKEGYTMTMQKDELLVLLQKYHLKPNKDLGQHYLLDDSILRQIVAAGEIGKNELVLEIGAGPGILTQALAQAGADVLAVEYDRQFCRLLQQEFHNWRNVHILCDDALRLDFSNLAYKPGTGTPTEGDGASTEEASALSPELKKDTSDSRYYTKIIANIPYQITNPLVRKILEPGSRIQTAILLIQKEVADRLMAPPGSSERGILTIMLEYYGSIEKICDVQAAAFWPAPKVESTVIKIRRNYDRDTKSDPQKIQLSRDLNSALLSPELETPFFWFVKQGFSGKRKTLSNSLSGGLRLPKNAAVAIVEEAMIDPLLRAEDLRLEQWLHLFQIYQKSLT